MLSSYQQYILINIFFIVQNSQIVKIEPVEGKHFKFKSE